MSADESSDDSDEWGTEELQFPIGAGNNSGPSDQPAGQVSETGNEEDWLAPAKPKPSSTNDTKKEAKEGEPMIIVDMTELDSNIHSQFDRNSVNDAEAASKLRKKIESNYDKYAKDANLLAQGAVIPCGSNVWRDALIRLRDERDGHYFVPIFPSK